jgi:ComF family protein
MRLVSLLAPPLCAACGGVARGVEPLCGACRSALTWLGPDPVVGTASIRVWAPVAYEGPARALVRALKYGGAWRAAELMAAQIVANWPPSWVDHLFGGQSRTVLVPVPLHPRRERRRGYDQATLIANAVGERTGLAVEPCLTRSGSAAAQVGRGRAERLSGPPGAIEARGPVPERALLADDVVTTGGTLAACAAALRAHGAREVAAVAYARTPGR